MGAYVVGFYTMWGQAFPKSYAEQAVRLVDKHGGRFLVRPIEFPSIENARAWYTDPEYQPLLRFRQTGSCRLDALLVEGR